MRPVALLAAADALPGSPGARYAREAELQLAAFDPPCRARGVRLIPALWSDPGIDWSRFDAAVIGATWDYYDQPAAFLAALDRIAAATRLFNPLHVVRWNIDKRYLGALADAGLRVIPTLFRDCADAAELTAALDALGAEEIVVKPRVGGGAWRQARHARGAPPPGADALPLGGCLIQPYLDSVVREGEISLLYYDGGFSHALRKRPAAGDYRVQAVHGGSQERHAPTEEEMRAGDAAVAAAAALLDTPLLYARVDLVADAEGEPALMELELVEPYHYPEQGPGCGERFAGALTRRLEA